MSDAPVFVALKAVRNELPNHNWHEAAEDMRQLMIWAQVHAYQEANNIFGDPAIVTLEKMKAITSKYPEACTPISNYVMVCIENYKLDLTEGHFADGSGHKYLTSCLTTFGEVMP